MRCEKCGFDYDSNLNRCPRCGASIEFSGNTMYFQQARTTHASFISTVFSGVLRKHPAGTAAKIFIAGTPETTPTTDKMFSVWQRPWLYSRFLIAGIIFTITFMFLMPAVAGSFGSVVFPFAVLLFVWEMNIPRDISFIKVVIYFFIGGLLSIIFVLIPSLLLPDYDAPFAAFVEEPAKLLTTLIIIHKLKPKYGFGGMLVGAAVGAGFAAFETVGYVFTDQGLDVFTLGLRSVLAVGGHVTWAAIAGAAAVLAQKGTGKGIGYLKSPLFWGCFVTDICLHFTWNGGLLYFFPYSDFAGSIFICIINTILAIILLFALTDRCLKQVIKAYDDARSVVINRTPYYTGQDNSNNNVQQASSAYYQSVQAATPSPVQSPVSSSNIAPQVSAPSASLYDSVTLPSEPTKPEKSVIKSEYLNIEKPIDKIINIGRDASYCDIVFPADTAGVSRRHCAVMASPEGVVYVMDLGSSNGTFLPGGRKIASNEWTMINDSFYIATDKYLFTIE